MRVRNAGYRADVQWMAIPMACVRTSVWFRSVGDGRYVPLSADKDTEYSNISAAQNSLPPVVIEAKPTVCSAQRSVPVYLHVADDPPSIPGVPVDVNVKSLIYSVVTTNGILAITAYNPQRKDTDFKSYTNMSSSAMDFLYLCVYKFAQSIPCILASTNFADLVEVRSPTTNMYYDPGITRVPMKDLLKVLDRAQERGLGIQLQRIDPNSLGQKYVLVFDEINAGKKDE